MVLPDKPSELIQVGLGDLRATLADRRYHVDMDVWHSPRPRIAGGEVTPDCGVCFAGAVMAQTMGVPIDLAANPECFSADVAAKLMALDAFRRGNVAIGLGYLQMRHPLGDLPAWVEVPEFYEDPEGFMAAMGDLASTLRAAGR